MFVDPTVLRGQGKRCRAVPPFGYGRFLEPDPIGYEAGPNLYAYVDNDPINFIDPLGLCAGNQVFVRTGGSSVGGNNGTDIGVTVSGFCMNWDSIFAPPTIARLPEPGRGGPVGGNTAGCLIRGDCPVPRQPPPEGKPKLCANPKYQELTKIEQTGTGVIIGGVILVGVGGAITLMSGGTAAPLGAAVGKTGIFMIHGGGIVTVGAQVGKGKMGDANAPFSAGAGMAAGRVVSRAHPVAGAAVGAAGESLIGGGACD